jgi:4-hydroxy-3-methylbut-2-enyl diphosphate reductase
MKIHRALHLGMCFGVRDAIALANQESKRGPLTVLGDLVHNDTVLADLKSRGVGIERNPDLVRTQAVMITAHGASEKLMTEVRRRGHRIVEATCPLVHHAHKSLTTLVAQGFHPVVIGQRGHVEVRGLTEDYPGAEVVLSLEDVERMTDREAFGVVAQTTQPVEKVRRILEMIRNRFPLSRVEFRDTVCQPTKLRQGAAIELAGNAMSWWWWAGPTATTHANWWQPVAHAVHGFITCNSPRRSVPNGSWMPRMSGSRRAHPHPIRSSTPWNGASRSSPHDPHPLNEWFPSRDGLAGVGGTLDFGAASWVASRHEKAAVGEVPNRRCSRHRADYRRLTRMFL